MIQWLLKYFQLIIIGLICSCSVPSDRNHMVERFETAISKGEFLLAAQIADSMKSNYSDSAIHWRIDSMMEISHRFHRDFSLTEEEIKQRVSSLDIDFTPEDWSEWENRNWLEMIIIDGQKRYFNRTAGNLKRMIEHRKKMENPEYLPTPDVFDTFRIKHINEIITAAKNNGNLVVSVSMQLNYQVTLMPDIITGGEVVRCWMPFPRVNHPRQVLGSLISTFPEKYEIAPVDALHRTVYFEQPAVPGEATIFRTAIKIKSFAQYFNLREMDILPYNKQSALYRLFTSEQPPHIVFSERIINLSEEIVGDAAKPDEIVRRIYYWIDKNIPWAGALEYSLMPNMPEYVLDNMRGDCGMVTLLFMTVARYNGIPVRWQSGWMLHPGEVNLHDWCEVYYEGVGWVPLDMSFGLMPSANLIEREFYISGIDAYRMIVNDDIGAPLIPAKKFFRSEPWDFQRGELEWQGGNLYFDQWRYKMEVEYSAESE
jgi:hypothetical protein